MSFIHFRWLDLLDILIVAFVIYRLFLLMKGTRAVQMLFGLLIIILVAILAQWWQMGGVSWIASSLKTVWIVAFVIIFQPEIRVALTQLGRNRFVGPFLKRESKVLDEVIKGIDGLVKRGVGAILVFERESGLKNYIDTGTRIDALVSAELLNSIFAPLSPLHDGAVIIRGETMLAAACVLPLSQSTDLPNVKGLRHRAGLGLVEESDGVAIIVSEENRTVSLAYEGKMIQNLTLEQLRRDLAKLLHIKE